VAEAAWAKAAQDTLWRQRLQSVHAGLKHDGLPQRYATACLDRLSHAITDTLARFNSDFRVSVDTPGWAEIASTNVVSSPKPWPNKCQPNPAESCLSRTYAA
jgi:hypothetical protein